jgi:hypothetical protein
MNFKNQTFPPVKFVSVDKLLTSSATSMASLSISLVAGSYVNSTASSKFLTILTSKKVIGCVKTVGYYTDVLIGLPA